MCQNLLIQKFLKPLKFMSIGLREGKALGNKDPGEEIVREASMAISGRLARTEKADALMNGAVGNTKGRDGNLLI